MSRDFRRALALGMVLATMACQAKPDQAVAKDAGQAMVAVEQAPPHAAAPALNADGSFDAKAIMAENDRVIAENERLANAVDARQRADPEKYGRLKSECEARLGAPSDAASAKGIIGCVEKAWQ